jgi:glycosyltransferase involved in cell wall biosynthesis
VCSSDLVEPVDPEGLLAALREVLADPEGARRRGEAGRRRALERHRPAVSAEKWWSLYGREVTEEPCIG